MSVQMLKIHSLRVRLHTSWPLAEPLQQAVSQVVRDILAGEIAAGIRHVSAAPCIIERLTLDLGDIPCVGFETQFVQRLVRQLVESIGALSASSDAVPIETFIGEAHAPAEKRSEQVEPEPAVAKKATTLQQGVPLSDKAPMVAGALSPESLLACMICFLQTGYWPTAGDTVTGGSGAGKDSPTQALDQLLGDRPEHTADVLARNLWCAASRRRLWQCLGERQHRQIIQHLTTEQQRVSVPELLSVSPAALMLAAWHYWVHQPSRVLSIVGGSASHGVLATLAAAEVSWLNDLLLASAAQPALLAVVLPPLRRQSVAWMSRLSAEARRLLLPEPPEQTLPGAPLTRLDLTRQGIESREPDVPLPQTLRVSNAGVVLLWPLLPRLFAQLELLEKPKQDAPYRFINQKAQQRAVCLLDALTWADDERAEWRCPVNKWLCGWPLTASLETWPAVNDATRALFTTWLSGLSFQIPGLQRCGPDELRALFLQRPGVMQESRAGWHLTVEVHASDMMLAQLPWPLKQLTLPWLPEPLEMMWQLPQYPAF